MSELGHGVCCVAYVCTSVIYKCGFGLIWGFYRGGGVGDVSGGVGVGAVQV